MGGATRVPRRRGGGVMSLLTLLRTKGPEEPADALWGLGRQLEELHSELVPFGPLDHGSLDIHGRVVIVLWQDQMELQFSPSGDPRWA